MTRTDNGWLFTAAVVPLASLMLALVLWVR